MRAFTKLNVMEPRDWCALLFSVAVIAVLGWAVWPHGPQALGLALDAGGFVLVWWFTLGARDLMRPEPDGGQTLDDERLHSPAHRGLSVAGVVMVLAGFVLQLLGRGQCVTVAARSAGQERSSVQRLRTSWPGL